MRLAVLGLLWSLPASAETILLPPLQGKGDLHRIEQELEKALGARGANVLGPHTKAAAEAAHCNGKAPCLGAAGRRTKADKVLSGHSSSDGKTLTVQFVLVVSESNAVVQTASLSFPAGSDAAKIVSDGLSRVVPADDEPALQAVAPIKKKQTTESFTASPTVDTPELAPLQRPSDKPTRALLYAGIGVAALGAVGLVLGGVFYGQAAATAAPVHDDTPQIPTVAAERKANDQLVVANAGFIAGGALLGIGAVLIGTDLLLRLRAQPRITVGAGGGHASIEVPW